ncbi:MAG: LysR family transcriptional regulator [Frankiales bacterium]|nr:LysR family transcriptional regulator [Frankiales bacterium]
MPTDLDLRKLRYFAAVAETGNLTRAAEQLHIAQPVLTRQIRALENELHATLFTRSARGTDLTPAGRQLLEDARPLLQSTLALQRRVRTAERGSSRFTIGFMPGLVVTAAARRFRERHPGLDIDVLRTSWADQTDVVHDGRVDVSFVRAPFDERNLTQLPLFTEDRVVALPARHPLAARQSLPVAELADLYLLESPELVPEWRAVATEFGTGAPRQRRPMLSMEEKLEHVAAEQGIAIIPRSTAQFYTRPDVVYVPVPDVAPSRVVLVWAKARNRDDIQEFTQIARAAVTVPTADADADPAPSTSG